MLHKMGTNTGFWDEMQSRLGRNTLLFSKLIRSQQR